MTYASKIEELIAERDRLSAALTEAERERDEAMADAAMLIHCRSSVGFDLLEYGKLLDRKGASCNEVDIDEHARLERLLSFIDAAIAKGAAS